MEGQGEKDGGVSGLGHRALAFSLACFARTTRLPGQTWAALCGTRKRLAREQASSWSWFRTCCIPLCSRFQILPPCTRKFRSEPTLLSTRGQSQTKEGNKGKKSSTKSFLFFSLFLSVKPQSASLPSYDDAICRKRKPGVVVLLRDNVQSKELSFFFFLFFPFFLFSFLFPAKRRFVDVPNLSGMEERTLV